MPSKYTRKPGKATQIKLKLYTKLSPRKNWRDGNKIVITNNSTSNCNLIIHCLYFATKLHNSVTCKPLRRHTDCMGVPWIWQFIFIRPQKGQKYITGLFKVFWFWTQDRYVILVRWKSGYNKAPSLQSSHHSCLWAGFGKGLVREAHHFYHGAPLVGYHSNMRRSLSNIYRVIPSRLGSLWLEATRDCETQ